MYKIFDILSKILYNSSKHKIMSMKEIYYLGNTLKQLKLFNDQIKEKIAYQLDRLKHSLLPNDWKPMKSIGNGVNEIRIHGITEVRVIYIAKLVDGI